MKLFNSLALAAALLSPGLVMAGSVVQYKAEKSLKGGQKFSRFTDGTPIGAAHRTDWVNQTFVFPNPDKDGEIMDVLNAYTGDGFPIGFDFYYGGQTFNQFVPSPLGSILLGYNGVEFNGQGGNLLGDVIMRQYMNHFAISMEPTSVEEGIREASISYKTTGEAGDRVCTVQWDKVTLNDGIEDEDGTWYFGTYSIQMRLYEKDGRIEIAFYEDTTTNKSHLGFFTGLHGWDTEDQIILTSAGLDKPVFTKMSSFAALGWSNVSVRWDGSDLDKNYSPVFVFTPGNSKDEPCTAGAPADLKIVQDKDNFIITCKKNPNAAESDGILIAYSLQPFTEADLPHDGVSYYALGNDDRYNTKIGNSTVVYCHNLATSCNVNGVQLGTQPYAEEASVTITGIPDNAPLYVRAYSYNGYPNYNTTDFAEAVVTSTQLPPSDFNVVKDGSNIELNWTSEYPVIIASTAEHPIYGDYGYTGQFGQPAADAKAGDEIDGGGKVIYAGDASEFTMSTADLAVNRPTFFRIWNVNGDVVSATWADGFVVSDPVYPYEPGIENWPIGQLMQGWSYESVNANFGLFRPVYRQWTKDYAVYSGCPDAVNGQAQPITLYTPALPAANEDMILKFDFAMETNRGMVPADPENPDGPQIPAGDAPGVFYEIKQGVANPSNIAEGVGLHVLLGLPGQETELQKIADYKGTMLEFSPGSYYDWSCSFQTEQVMLPAYPEGSRVALKFGTTTNSLIFLRNFSIQPASAVKTVGTSTDVEIRGGIGEVALRAGSDRTVDIYSISGARAASVELRAGDLRTVALPAGIYIAEGVKVVVR